MTHRVSKACKGVTVTGFLATTHCPNATHKDSKNVCEGVIITTTCQTGIWHSIQLSVA